MEEAVIVRKTIEVNKYLWRDIKVAVAGIDNDTVRDFLDRAARRELETIKAGQESD